MRGLEIFGWFYSHATHFINLALDSNKISNLRATRLHPLRIHCSAIKLLVDKSRGEQSLEMVYNNVIAILAD